MLRYYSFNYQKKEIRCASVLKDFLPNKKALLNHYNELPTELYKEFKKFKKEIKDFKG